MDYEPGLTTEDEEDDGPTLGHQIGHVLAWPGFKAMELILGNCHTGSGMGNAVGLFFFGIPIFILTSIVVWGGLFALVGNLIAFGIRGHF